MAKRTRLLAIARAADPDAWRDRIRDLFQRTPIKRKILDELAASADIAALPAPTLCFLGANLLSAGRSRYRTGVLHRHSSAFQKISGLTSISPCATTGWSRRNRARHSLPNGGCGDPPKKRRAHQNLGLALAKVGNLSDAVIEYRKAILLKSDYAGAHNGLGHALVRLKKYAEAVAAFREAIRFNPQSPPMHHDLALALCLLGKFGKALTEFRQATLLKPDYPVSHYSVGICLQKLGKSAEAVAEFREAIRLKPDETVPMGTLLRHSL